MFSGKQTNLSVHAHNYKQTKSDGNNHNKDSHNRFQKLNSILSVCVQLNALFVVKFTKTNSIHPFSFALHIFGSAKTQLYEMIT